MHRRRKLPENGVVIVLGARVVGASKTCPAHLSHAFQYRVDTAASYLKAHPKAVCMDGTVAGYGGGGGGGSRKARAKPQRKR